MSLRGFTIGDYHTGNDWGLILTSKSLTPPEPKTYYVDIDGRDGSLDLSESLAGEIKFKDRTIDASFILADGTRAERTELLQTIINYFNGKQFEIVEPDDLEHYLVGRITVTDMENTQAYGTLTIEATCEPWRYAGYTAVVSCDVSAASSSPITLLCENSGTKTLCPTITVAGDIYMLVDDDYTELTDGEYQILDLKLYSGANYLTLYGDGTVVVSYREAIL